MPNNCPEMRWDRPAIIDAKHLDRVAPLAMSSQDSQCPDVSVVVVSYNTAHLLPRMFAALEAGRGTLRLQVIVVDNASGDKSVEILRTQYPGVELIENQSNVGFGRANNQAISR